MVDITICIGENLYLNVPEAVDGSSLDEDLPARRLSTRPIEAVLQLVRPQNEADSTSSTSIHRFKHDRKPKLPNKILGLPEITHGFGRGQQRRHISCLCESASIGFVANLPQNSRTWSHKMDSCVPQSIGKVCIFGKESIARMDGIRFRLDGDADKLGDVGEIRRLVEQDAFIAVDGVIRILRRVNRDGVNFKVSCGSQNSDRNLAPILPSSGVGNYVSATFYLTGWQLEDE